MLERDSCQRQKSVSCAARTLSVKVSLAAGVARWTSRANSKANSSRRLRTVSVPIVLLKCKDTVLHSWTYLVDMTNWLWALWVSTLLEESHFWESNLIQVCIAQFSVEQRSPAKTNFPGCIFVPSRDDEKKKKGLGWGILVLFLHAAFLLRLFLLSVRRLVHPAPYSQWCLLKNSPVFSETWYFLAKISDQIQFIV